VPAFSESWIRFLLENSYIETFNARPRDELLNGEHAISFRN